MLVTLLTLSITLSKTNEQKNNNYINSMTN